jgi:hypothetical protein
LNHKTARQSGPFASSVGAKPAMAMTVSRFFTVSAFVHFDAYGERRRRKVKFPNHLLTIDDLLSLTGDRSASSIPAREGQQTTLMLHRCRPLLVRQRTILSNAWRTRGRTRHRVS